MKRFIVPTLAVLAVSTVGAHAAAADVIDAIDGLGVDVSSGVTAGVTLGAIVFGAKVVWGAIKSLAS